MSNAPKVFKIVDWHSTEVVPCGSSDRRLTICNEGPDRVLACIGGIASTENYSNVFDSGFNSCDFPIGDQRLSLICPRGKSAQVRIGIIEASENEKLKALASKIFPAFVGASIDKTYFVKHNSLPLPTPNYYVFAQYSLQAARAFMKQCESLKSLTDDGELEGIEAEIIAQDVLDGLYGVLHIFTSRLESNSLLKFMSHLKPETLKEILGVLKDIGSLFSDEEISLAPGEVTPPESESRLSLPIGLDLKLEDCAASRSVTNPWIRDQKLDLCRHTAAILLQGLLAKHGTIISSSINEALVDEAVNLANQLIDRTF